MKVYVPKERDAGETRVAATPETVKHLVDAGLSVDVESGAGEASGYVDEAYRAVGSQIASDDGWSTADVVLKVTPPTTEDAAKLKASAILVSQVAPYKNHELVGRLRDGKTVTLALELIPRITRAQSMDVLSSQANIAGYKAVLVAAERLDKYFPLLMTAAGTIKPARVVIMGAGVAGLQAIATAKRLGAVVEVSDIRPEVKEQIESVGGKFIELPMQESGAGEGGYAKEMTPEFLKKQREIVAEHVSHADVVITTALVPGRPAPTLVTREMVERMRPGSVIVDLAVSQGGNCELSQADEEVIHAGVRILGVSNLPASMPKDASTVFARNIWALLKPFTKEGKVELDFEDEVIAGCLLTREGSITHEPTKAAVGGES